MIDLGVVDNPDVEEESEPVEFGIAFTRILPAEGDDAEPTKEKQTEKFTAYGDMPYGTVLAYLAASIEPNLAVQGAAVVEFLQSAMSQDQRELLDLLLTDRQVMIQASTLQTVAARLAIHYTRPRLGPTKRASSCAPKKSPGGPMTAKRGSSGRSPAKGSTS